MKIIVRTTIITGFALLLAACGGSDDKSTRSGPPATPPPVATSTPTPTPSPPPVATPTPTPTPTPPANGNAWSRHPEYCTRDPENRRSCLNWAPAAVKAASAYERLAARHPGELPGHGVKVTVIDTGIDLRHWEFARDRTTEENWDFLAGDWLGDEVSHGTAVASLIGAQRTTQGVPGNLEDRNFHGIAYGAQMHVIGIELGSGPSPGTLYAPIRLGNLSRGDERDAELLQLALNGGDAPGGRSDIVNMSFGVQGNIEQYTEDELRSVVPREIEVAAQRVTPQADRSILVYSAGNANGRDCSASTPRIGSRCVGGKLQASSPQVGSAVMARIEELRAHSVAVVATDREGRMSDFSNRCGIAAKWCLAAPGEDMLIARYGDEDDWGARGYGLAQGTSFAAPVVSGGLAVVMHYFRGQLGNPQALARVLGTASRHGHAAPDPVRAGETCPAHLNTDSDPQCELSSTHGWGVMDLDAATRGVGTLRTGSSAATATLDSTYLYTPAAWGDVGRRLGAAEIAAFDDWDNAPFWAPLGSRIGTRSDPGRGVFPTFAAEAPEGTGATWGALAWRPAAEGGPLSPLHLAYSADPGGEIHAAGVAWTPGAFGGAMRAGLVFEQDRLLGGRGEGAFTSAGASHGLAFGTFVRTFGLGRRDGQDARPPLRLAITSTWAGGRLTGGSGMLVEASALYSQHRVALEHEREGNLSRISIEQPLRAESGSAAVHRPVGRDRLSGRWQYGTHKFGLRPEARALTLGLHHERDFAGGRVALGAAHTLDAGHVAGREESSIGARYRLRF